MEYFTDRSEEVDGRVVLSIGEKGTGEDKRYLADGIANLSNVEQVEARFRQLVDDANRGAAIREMFAEASLALLKLTDQKQKQPTSQIGDWQQFNLTRPVSQVKEQSETWRDREPLL